MKPTACMAFLGLALAVGCAREESGGAAGDSREAASATATSPAEAIRARAATRFALADFLKPAEEQDAALDPYEAPLLYRELARADDPRRPAEGIGTVERGADGLLRVDPRRPAVYFERSTAVVAGEERERLAFLWFRPTAVPGELAAQGVRATLGPDGRHRVFEVLRDSSGLDVAFVTRPAADAVDAPPPEGRAFSVERPVAEAPEVVVAGLTEAGPMPLGPFVYLPRGSNDVAGLHCRCEPSRVGEVRTNVPYALLPFDALRALGLESPAWPAGDLAERLRLPAVSSDRR